MTENIIDLRLIIFCEDALVKTKYQIGPATILPCENFSIENIKNQLFKFCDQYNIKMISEDEIKKQLNNQLDRIKPSFAIYIDNH